MTVQMVLEETQRLLEHLGLTEEPFGIYYADTKPENAFGPKPGAPISRELEDNRQLDMQEVFKTFSCVMCNIRVARKRKSAAFISTEEYGCIGGAYYCSMMKPHLRFIEYYVTTGFNGTPLHGERYMPTPQAMQEFLAKVDPRKAAGKYCIFKPLSTFADGEQPEFVIFFARPEVLTGLFTHTVFTTGDMECVASPFGAGCTNLVSWPLYYQAQGVDKAVLGGFDPSARKYMKGDELTFTVSWSLYQKMLKALPESMFNVDGAWQEVRTKVSRSAAVWGEDAGSEE